MPENLLMLIMLGLLLVILVACYFHWKPKGFTIAKLLEEHGAERGLDTHAKSIVDRINRGETPYN